MNIGWSNNVGPVTFADHSENTPFSFFQCVLWVIWLWRRIITWQLDPTSKKTFRSKTPIDGTSWSYVGILILVSKCSWLFYLYYLVRGCHYILRISTDPRGSYYPHVYCIFLVQVDDNISFLICFLWDVSCSSWISSTSFLFECSVNVFLGHGISSVRNSESDGSLQFWNSMN